MLEQFKLGMQELSEAFMKHKDWDEYEPNGGYWIGGKYDTDYWVFSDGSDYYHWSPSQMYEILTENISYDIATEHQDWSINNDWDKIDWWVRLTVYAILRKGNMEMSAKDFQRKLEREYHLDRADRLTDEAVAKDKEFMEKQEEDMRVELSKYIK